MMAACASSPAPSAESAQPATAPAPAARTEAAKPAETPAPDTALAAPVSGDQGTVVFFRPSKMGGSLVSFKVREGDKELGKLSNGTYFSVALPAGAHAFVVHSEAKDVLNLEIEPGETYYVVGSVSMGLMVGRPNIAPSDVATFEAAKAKLKDSTLAKPKE
jgi:hypothetical protein